MITALTVQNFRCFRDLKIEPLERVNLIAGRNNAGKTALLEAIYFHVPTYGERLLRENPFRDTQRLSQAKVQLENLFYQKDPQREILIHSRLAPPGSWQVSGKRSRHGDPTRYDYAHFHYQVDDSEYSRLTCDEANDRLTKDETGGPLLPVEAVSSVLTPMTDADTERFSQLEEQGRLKTLIEALQILDPRLCRLTLLLKQKIPVIYADIGIGTLIPLQMMGEGVMRLTKLVIGIASAPGGLVLMDEVENGLHYSVMKRVWGALAAAARAADAQIFATTHSWECLTAAHAAFSESEAYDFRLQRLERLRDTNDIRAVTLDQESLQAAIEGGFEVR